ncbi:translation elongation factor-like protein [candidate division MSBL1 archaeon SCGC-AAA259B11]|uniref:Translation elongation factor-like protein n=1 Tax=candidate division MSBL1 archaeon SCGC-AAA259B11 TaxID=1698260 RepID=A0A133U8C6_9EURY|nr:translation elongation factor-like protein [candidate division MSBL1 archaeon SCGC-AAA259B11]
MVEEPVEKEKVGEVTHYFTDISVGVIDLSGTVEIGDKISIEGATTNFQQEIESMEIEHEDVEKAGAGDAIGIKVKDRVREGDIVYRIK